MLFHVPATISHAFAPPLRRRIVPERNEPLAKEGVHATEVRDLGRALIEEIDLKPAFQQRLLMVVGRSGIVRAEDFGHGETIGKGKDAFMHGRTRARGGEGLPAEMHEVGHLRVAGLS